MEDSKNEVKPELKNNSKLARIATVVFIGIGAVSLIALITGFSEIMLLQSIKSGEAVTLQEAELNDMMNGIAGIVQTVIRVASVFVFLAWFSRLYMNLHSLKTQHPLKEEEHMAIWSFFIPVVSLYKPYRIANEIVSVTQRKLKELIPDFAAPRSNTTIGVWWALFLLSNFAAFFAVKMQNNNETIDQMIGVSQAHIISDFVDVLAAIATFLMIRKLHQNEERLLELVQKEPFNNKTSL